MMARPRSRKGCLMSQRITLKPERAQTWAMPLPMVPAPRTAMVLSSDIRVILATSKFSSLGMRFVADNGGGKVFEDETFGEARCVFSLPMDMRIRNLLVLFVFVAGAQAQQETHFVVLSSSAAKNINAVQTTWSRTKVDI